MNTLRKPFYTIIFSILLLYVSCNQYESDNIQKFDEKSYKLAKNQLNGYTLIDNKVSGNYMNHEIMEYLQQQNNVNIEFSNKIYELNNKTTDEKIELILKTGVFNQVDLELIQSLENRLKMNNFDNAISKFEETIINRNFSKEKFETYNTLVNVLKLINSMDASLFQIKEYSAKNLNFDCVLATIAFGAACVALATLEVGTGGLATAAVVVGYIAASAAWVRACKQ